MMDIKKRGLFFLVLILLLVGWSIYSSRQTVRQYDFKALGSLPVQANGRVKPIDSLARSHLLMISGRQQVETVEGCLSAIEWFSEVLMRPEVADGYPVFRIDHSEVLGLLNRYKNEQKFFSFNQLKPFFEQIHQQANSVTKEPELQTSYEKQLLKLHDSLSLYYGLVHTVHTVGMMDDLELEYTTWLLSIEPGMDAIRTQEEEGNVNLEDMQRFIAFADRYLEVSKISRIGIVPPVIKEDIALGRWNNIGQSLLDGMVNGEIQPIVLSYGRLTKAYRANDVDMFNREVNVLKGFFEAKIPTKKIYFEFFFNQIEPFYKSIVLYIASFMIVCLAWMLRSKMLNSWAFDILFVALLIHTFGLCARSYIQGRPPVTNLYSASLFIGWAAVMMGAFIERFYRNGLAVGVSSVVGTITLIIAHHLSMEGDTLEMMRAVLDSNFWLSTHVIVVTLGYSAMFIAGFLGVFYVVRGLVKKVHRDPMNRNLVSMAYGVLFFALLFSFVGTMLGGVWADQSWGRFWGWDPKENGALMIVLWCAITLHAKWGKLVKDRGFMLMAVFGNIVTSWSFFGTNMLGVGLHSYGFMDAAFGWLIGFILVQLCIIALGLILIKKP